MSRPAAARRRAPCVSAVVLLAGALLGGCAQNLDLGILYAAPGKYDYLRCQDLPARLAGAVAREKQLNDLIARANQEPGGQVVSTAAYSADLAQARAEQKMLRQTAVDKNCGSIEPGAPAPAGAAAPAPAPAAVQQRR
ncbi:hypothetical protein PQJ75_05240 [Rhodoplanes sp. TEM]|uniref:Twin-arginine translocation pathway signal n=1 Tax=Rhodoplanes tepidamans TaxID=200616 RepID=A0ABT5JA68_RHOTP|nr:MULTISPECIES: hypothetical protein [Rhodoplanes]MDC7786535.1 hypothetical protein [Rhodoplanes tepidamans]MDC7983127.1 hypothetical protein [Rhodoplanes sp. TEM]MDQ0357585.1 hypothetical protein [Rhodoplanes tepidamans]